MRRRWTGRPRRAEFAPVSSELLIALASTKMTDRARRVLLAIIASSYGRYREHDVPLRRTELEQLTSLDRSNVAKAITELQRAGMITVEERGRGKRAVFRIVKLYGEWAEPTVLHPKAETTWRSVPAASDVAHEPQDHEADEFVAHEPQEVDEEPHRRGPTTTPASRVNWGKNEEGIEAADAATIAALEQGLDTPWPDTDQAAHMPPGGFHVTGRDLPPPASASTAGVTERQLTPGDAVEVRASKQQRAAAARHGREIVKAMRDEHCTPALLEQRFGRLSSDPQQSHDLWQSWMWKEQLEWESRFDQPHMTETELQQFHESLPAPGAPNPIGTDASTTGATP